MSLIKSIIPCLLLSSLSYRASSQTTVSKEETITCNYLSLKSVPHLYVQREMLYTPTKEWTYSHHAGITQFKDFFIATWSNAYKDEDSPGQRVLYSISKDFFHWSKPEVLALPHKDDNGALNILTAAGFHKFRDTLVAYFGEYDTSRTHTSLWARTTTDGKHWSEPIDMNMPVNPNLGPFTTLSGRLIICGNYTLPYTDDHTGLGGWKMSSFYAADSATALGDNPWTFGMATAKMNLPRLCEVSVFQTDDSVLHALFRNTSRPKEWFMYEAESRDDGAHWSIPVLTSFPNKDSKFNFGRLPDGRFYYVGNPDTAKAASRNPLVVSLSADGKNFNQTYIIADDIYKKHQSGKAKFGQYGYPTTIVYKDHMYVIISREKEAIEVIRFNWKELQVPAISALR